MQTFVCHNCKKVVGVKAIGTHQRNHCPYCLYSLHVDEKVPGDRKSRCHGLMEPVGLTFKDEGTDKYGKKRQGESVIIHQCAKCGKTNRNRIAGDDDPRAIMSICEEKDKEEVKRQLFGK